MAIFKREPLARSLLFACGFALLSSLAFGAYGHLVPTAVFRYITFDHELRRVLGRAERDNFRSAMTTESEGTVVDPPQELGEVPPLSQMTVTRYRISVAQRSLIASNTLILDLSPVLNL
jgi:hypothetical protein